MSKDIVSPRTLSVHKEHELLGRLEAAGLGEVEAQLVIGSKNNELARKLVTFIRMGGYEPTASQKMARAILGTNYIGVEKSIEHLNVMPSAADFKALEEVPFSEDELEACKDTHILVAVLPVSVMDLWERAKHLFYDEVDPEYRNQAFAKRKGQAGWHLIRRDIVPGSTHKTWQEQQSMLMPNEEAPTARVLTYAVILTVQATDVKLLWNNDARVSDMDSRGIGVSVFFGGGLRFFYIGDGSCISNLGVSSSRKPSIQNR